MGDTFKKGFEKVKNQYNNAKEFITTTAQKVSTTVSGVAQSVAEKVKENVQAVKTSIESSIIWQALKYIPEVPEVWFNSLYQGLLYLKDSVSEQVKVIQEMIKNRLNPATISRRICDVLTVDNVKICEIYEKASK